MKKSITKDKKNSEMAILEAAEKEFIEKGYDGAKTTSIAASAGVTHAMLHYYYRSKENLFNHVFDQKATLLATSVISAFGNSGTDVIERIKGGMSAHFDFIVNNPLLPRFVINEMISKPEKSKIITDKILKYSPLVLKELQKEIDKEVKRGIIREVNAFDLILDILSLNVFIFLVEPIVMSIATTLYNDKELFYQARKKENIEIIMKRLIIEK